MIYIFGRVAHPIRCVISYTLSVRKIAGSSQNYMSGVIPLVFLCTICYLNRSNKGTYEKNTDRVIIAGWTP